MGTVTFGLVWVGYWFLAYGVATVRGCNVKLTEIAFPGKFTGCNPDKGSSGGAPPEANPASNGTLPNRIGLGIGKVTGLTKLSGAEGVDSAISKLGHSGNPNNK